MELRLSRYGSMALLMTLVDACRILEAFLDTSELVLWNCGTPSLPHVFACNFFNGTRDDLIISRYNDTVLPKRIGETCGRNEVFLKQGDLLPVIRANRFHYRKHMLVDGSRPQPHLLVAATIVVALEINLQI